MASSSPLQTLSTKLMSCLGSDDMADVHLLGTDGVKVPAFRTILACGSYVFRKMLFGTFEESTSNVVKLGYSSEVLRAVVEFCITDNFTQFEGRAEETAARGIVQLIACAHFLDMPLLQVKAITSANSLLKANKPLACAIYDEAFLVGEPTYSIKLIALANIRMLPKDYLLSEPGIVSLGPEALGEIVSDVRMDCEEIILFRALNKWAKAGNEVNSVDLDPNQDRMSIAKGLAATHIHLSSIQPTKLSGIVRKSCLVDKMKIFEALEAHAILAEREPNAQFSKKRKVLSGVVVSGAGTDVVNGFYDKDGEYKGAPKYTRKCLWEGQERTSCIYRYENDRWYISIVAKDGVIGARENDFYEGVNHESVPMKGWKSKAIGCAPSPVCQDL